MFSTRLGFRLEQETYNAIHDNAESIRRISAERVRMELERILTASSREDGWKLLVVTGLHKHIVEGVDWRTCGPHCPTRILADLPYDEIPLPLALAAIFLPLEGIAPTAADACRALKCSEKDVYGVEWLLRGLKTVRAEPELADVKQLMANRLWPHLLRLVRADLIAGNRPLRPFTSLAMLAGSIPAERVAPPPLVTGDDLIGMGLKPGPLFGRIIREIRREQLNETTVGREAAMALAGHMAEEE